MVYYQNKKTKGMTFVEMIITMAIIGIFFSSFFYVWNTFDIFSKARDTKRLNDLQVLDSAIKTVLLAGSDISLGQENIIYTSLPDTSSTCGSYNLVKVFPPYSYRCQSQNDYLKIDGSGWLPINFTLSKIVGFSILPVDPLNNKDYFYAYQVKNGRYKISAKLETKSFIPKMVNDGGFESTLYEVGSNLFIPSPHSGLVGYWSFDETGTTIKDLSGYNNHGTGYSSTTITDLHSTSSCKIGFCLNFDGVDDYVNVNSSASIPYGSSPRTVSLWIYTLPDSWATDTNTVFEYGSNFIRKAFGIDMHTYPNIQFYSGGDDIYVDTGAPQTGWIFITATYDGGTKLKVYINGELKETKTFDEVLNTEVTNVNIGRSYLINQYYIGKLDEVHIYNRALSPEEIKSLYEAKK